MKGFGSEQGSGPDRSLQIFKFRIQSGILKYSKDSGPDGTLKNLTK